jgi:DNA/RNA endonuclease G (NUC1)
MKKLIVIALMLPLFCLAQTVKHSGYLTHYDAKLGEPDSVSWDILKGSLNCKHLPRANNFIADPLISNTDLSKYYIRSGYDRGHQFPAQDASCNPLSEVQCFYMSNMVPQCPNLNRITWKALEDQTRVYALTTDVHVLCGIIGSKGVLKNKISIPRYCYKAIYKNKQWTAYIMPNEDSVKNHFYTFYQVTLACLNKQTGLKLK